MVDAAALPHGGDERVAVACALRMPMVPTATSAADVVAPRLVGHAGDRVDGPRDRRRGDVAGLGDALAEARDLGAVDDRGSTSRPSRCSPMWNLTELVPTSMTA